MTFEVAVQRLRSVADAAAQLNAALPNGVPNRDAARVRLAEGVPALAGEPLIDLQTLAANVRALGGDVSDVAAMTGETALCEVALTGAWDSIPSSETRQEAITLLDFATRPALRAGYAATRDLITAAQWTRGTCPACGALPIIAELHGRKDGESRTLRCGRCTAAWSFPRLACPRCGERDHKQLRYVHVDGEVAHSRVEACLTCRFYVKGLARLDPISDGALFLLDLETIGLDAVAHAAGYTRNPD